MVDIQQFLFMDKLNQEMIILMELPVIIPMEDAHTIIHMHIVIEIM